AQRQQYKRAREHMQDRLDESVNQRDDQANRQQRDKLAAIIGNLNAIPQQLSGHKNRNGINEDTNHKITHGHYLSSRTDTSGELGKRSRSKKAFMPSRI